MNLRTCTRPEWEANRAYLKERTGEWGFDPCMPWHIANWRERIGIVFFYFMMWGVIFPGMLVGSLMLIGMIFEGYAHKSMEIDRCKKHAVTPYEYHRC